MDSATPCITDSPDARFECMANELHISLERLRNDFLATSDKKDDAAKAEFKLISDRLSSLTSLINSETQLREMAFQQVTKRFQELFSANEHEVETRRREMASNLAMIQELKAQADDTRQDLIAIDSRHSEALAALRIKLEYRGPDAKLCEEQVAVLKGDPDKSRNSMNLAEALQDMCAAAETSCVDLSSRVACLERHCNSLEKRSNEFLGSQSLKMDSLCQRQDHVFQSLEQMRLECSNDRSQIQEILGKLSETELSLGAEARELIRQEQAQRDEHIQRLEQTLVREQEALVSHLERKVDEKLWRESAQRESIMQQGMKETTKAIAATHATVAKVVSSTPEPRRELFDGSAKSLPRTDSLQFSIGWKEPTRAHSSEDLTKASQPLNDRVIFLPSSTTPLFLPSSTTPRKKVNHSPVRSLSVTLPPSADSKPRRMVSEPLSPASSQATVTPDEARFLYLSRNSHTPRCSRDPGTKDLPSPIAEKGDVVIVECQPSPPCSNVLVSEELKSPLAVGTPGPSRSISGSRIKSPIRQSSARQPSALISSAHYSTFLGNHAGPTAVPAACGSAVALPSPATRSSPRLGRPLSSSRVGGTSSTSRQSAQSTNALPFSVASTSKPATPRSARPLSSQTVSRSGPARQASGGSMSVHTNRRCQRSLSTNALK